ncbi:major facilitator superfamily domain-containing protein [Fusarium solani]|uniref:Major facilitator superfamily domain-containing protein n=1 Tax=Fusarium solani TaxID=169388 RepID=A0A9P9KSZ5_FUSSL|nr:major facilitator superfamily domain-containing protein [Fusarium solani]KAH7267961.1 major facilitator superfamily domain-containing protein [Fusarium solani]
MSQQRGAVRDGGKAAHPYKWRTSLTSFCIILCQFVQMIPVGAGINGSLHIAKALRAPLSKPSGSLTQGTFVIIGGRIGAVYGHKITAVVAGAAWVIFHLIAGFMRHIISVCIMRTLSGIGAAFVMPNAIALITINFLPGKTRNLTVGLFGAMAPIGAAGGSVFPMLFGQLLPWWWLFFFLEILEAVVYGLFFLVVESEEQPMDRNGKIDYAGAYFGVSGLFLFNFSWTQASLVGWDHPYVYSILLVSLLHLVVFGILEVKVADQPIIPMSIWSSPSFSMMIVSAFISFMSFGMLLWYVTVWNLEVRGYSVLLNAAAFVPLTIGGAGAAILSAHIVRYVAAQYIFAIGSLATPVSLILVATMPEQQSYWAQVFPALLLASLGPDFLFTASQLIASGTVKRSQQGVAGSLIGTVLAYGLATRLGFAGTVEYYTNNQGKDLVKGYRNGLYLGIGMAGAAIVLPLLSVRIPKDTREGWDEETIAD